MNRNQIFKNLFVLNIIILFINYFLLLIKTNNILLKKLHFKFDIYLFKNNFIKNNFYDIETNNKRKNKTIVLYFEDNHNHTLNNIFRNFDLLTK